MSYLARDELFVGAELVDVLESEALPATGVEPERFWHGLSAMIHELSPRNAELLGVRATMQAAIDRWHRDHAGRAHDPAQYRAFLEEIGYLVPVGPPFSIDTDRADPEITTIAGPQLVVPVTNARYAINAANARWGSLYDALYGTDALGDARPAGAVRSGSRPASHRLGAELPRRGHAAWHPSTVSPARTATRSPTASSKAA